MALNVSTGYIFSPSRGPNGPLLDSNSPCAVFFHSWCYSALSTSVLLVSVFPVDYELFEVGDRLIHLCNYNSQQKHVYWLEGPSFY